MRHTGRSFSANFVTYSFECGSTKARMDGLDGRDANKAANVFLSVLLCLVTFVETDD